MVGRKPTREQDPEAVELIEKLKKKLECASDSELARKIEVSPQQISDWKSRGIPTTFKGALKLLAK